VAEAKLLTHTQNASPRTLDLEEAAAFLRMNAEVVRGNFPDT
jgi:hypothetical protein